MIYTGTGIISSPFERVATYIGTTIETVGSDSYSETVNFGTRGLVVAVIQAETNASGRTISRVQENADLDFIQATQITSAVGGGQFTITGIFYLQTNTTGNQIIDIDFSASVSRCFISIYRVSGILSNTPIQTRTSSATSGTGLSLAFTSLPADAVGIAAETIGSDGVTSVAWTNATLDYNLTAGTGTTRVTGADFRTTSSGNRTVSVSHTNSTQALAMAGCVWF